MKIIKFFRKLFFKAPVLSFDIGSMAVSWYLAYCIRYNFDQKLQNFISPGFYVSLAVIIALHTGIYFSFRVYRGLWRFSSINDVLNIIKASMLSLFIAIPVLYFISNIQSIPRTVFFLYFVLVVIMQCAGRLFARLWSETPYFSEYKNTAKKRVHDNGAGSAGENLIRDLKRSNQYIPVALLDDSPGKIGLSLHGIRVSGFVRDINAVAKRMHAELIFIAIPSAKSAAMRRIIKHCEKTELPVRTLPGLNALAAGRVEVNAVRDVNIEDLLGRDQVTLEWNKISASLHNKNIIITGGGGSIGSELCRQILAQKPGKILIIDHSEYNLYKIDHELRDTYKDAKIDLALISVTDRKAVDYYFQKFNPDIVFHAAAYKHVPMLEEQIRVAVWNNVIGTQITAEAAVAAGVDQFILISTDKAVNPTNIMGSTKRIAELYCQNLNQRVPTRFTTVRFGNVLGSAGSVVPLFTKQLHKGGPLTVTHPEIERYFMTIPEACQLILQAMVKGEGGEIFVLDMGEPVKIRYLAEQMIRLAGKIPDKDIEIVYTGLRPGEKLFEELFHTSEQLVQTDHEKLFKARFRNIEWEYLIELMQEIQNKCELYSEIDLFNLIKTLVPEFTQDTILKKLMV